MAKNILVLQTTMFQKSKAEVVFLAFSACVLVGTRPYSSGGDASATPRAEGLLRRRDDCPFCDSSLPGVVPMVKDRECRCSEYSLVSGIHWASPHATVALACVCSPALLFKTMCVTEGEDRLS